MNANRTAATITTTLITSVISNESGDSWGDSVGVIVGEGLTVESGVGVTEGDGVGVTEGVGIGVAEGVGVGVGVVGAGGMVMLVGMDGARGFGTSRYGMKFNVPKLVAFLWSQIVWLISEASVVPHQLSNASKSSDSVK